MPVINKTSLCFPKWITVAVFTLIFFKAYAQTVTNVSDNVNSILISKGKVDVTRNTTTRVWVTRFREPGDRGSAGYWENRIVPVTTQEYLQATKIRTLKVNNVEFGEVTTISMPDKFNETSQNFVNTSSLNSTQQITLSLSFTRTTSMSLTNSITHTTTMGTNFSLRLEAFQLGGSIQVQEGETKGTTYLTGENSTITRSSTVSATIPPKSAVRVSFREWTVRHQIKFKCLVIVDADISPNDGGITLLSQMVDEKNRTFEITGIITADDCSEGVTTQSDPIKLTTHQLNNLSTINLKFN